MRRRGLDLLRQERGIALPTAMMMLLILGALITAFLTLAPSEPRISSNQVLSSQALALAEAGVDQAIWALNNPSQPQGIPSLAAVPARYSSPLPHGAGGTFIPFGAGGYTLTVAPVGGASSQAVVTATGWTPTVSGFRAKAAVQATLTAWDGRFKPPAAVTARGQIQFANSAEADGRTSSCGNKYGTFSLGSAFFSGKSNATGRPTGSAQNQPASAFSSLLLTEPEISALKKAAQGRGTYYRGDAVFPTFPGGLVFVDTVSGDPVGESVNVADLASVTVTGGSASGWLIVMGSVTLSGNIRYAGLVYALDVLSYSGSTGSAGIDGVLIAMNVSNPTPSASALVALSKASVRYDCDALQPPAGLSPSYFVLPGSWKPLVG